MKNSSLVDQKLGQIQELYVRNKERPVHVPKTIVVNSKKKNDTLGKWVSEQYASGGSKLTAPQKSQLVEMVGPLEKQRKRN